MPKQILSSLIQNNNQNSTLIGIARIAATDTRVAATEQQTLPVKYSYIQIKLNPSNLSEENHEHQKTKRAQRNGTQIEPTPLIKLFPPINRHSTNQGPLCAVAILSPLNSASPLTPSDRLSLPLLVACRAWDSFKSAGEHKHHAIA